MQCTGPVSLKACAKDNALTFLPSMLFISVHMLNTVKEIQLMHNVTVYLSTFVFLVPQHVSANSYAVIKGVLLQTA
jgi:hypothetical protein